MATEVIFPKIGFSMTEGQIAEWMFGNGEQVTEGECLFLLEADKSTNEVEAPATGKLTVKIDEGETVPVGTVVAIIE
ncbi:biotin/lipoyl-containing protein [Novosphingopyxis baekryungensis]|uniref:biotin/lipoyl-containing protein n=1 Tax=Novosphingopyxis baekryungensis TaxID=279369 RepID=UPI0003B4ACBE|nr:biotin/lipoyl-containing protein [Novosphingopyxis baekryungensis]